MRLLLLVAFLISSLSTPMPAQRGGGRSPSPSNRSPRWSTTLTPSSAIFVSGRVVIDDGSPLTESASIQTICSGQKRTETHTDSQGAFSFQFGARQSTLNDLGNDADTSTRASSNSRPQRPTLEDCELQASLAGFKSDLVLLGGRFLGDQSANIGRITLHRLADVEGFTISATTAEAPGPARKAWARGREQAGKAQWDDAEKSFQEAVTLFPRFAAAWFELGQAQLFHHEPAAARHSFQQSIAADAKYVSPYRSLIQLARLDRNWHELADLSEKLLALNPVSYPDVWLYASLGYYAQQNWGAAERCARRGLEMDSEHRVPRLEFMLGMVLLEKADYAEASRHIRTFLGLAKQPAEIAEARRQLDEIKRRTSAANMESSR